ncbi:hypothetical protein FAIPA1_240009 [Frankia sp. AiPs1]
MPTKPGRRVRAAGITRTRDPRTPSTVTTSNLDKTVSTGFHWFSDAERKAPVTTPSFVLHRSRLVGRYGACCV